MCLTSENQESQNCHNKSSHNYLHQFSPLYKHSPSMNDENGNNRASPSEVIPSLNLANHSSKLSTFESNKPSTKCPLD